jgi:hypothetical protein
MKKSGCGSWVGASFPKDEISDIGFQIVDLMQGLVVGLVGDRERN